MENKWRHNNASPQLFILLFVVDCCVVSPPVNWYDWLLCAPPHGFSLLYVMMGRQRRIRAEEIRKTNGGGMKMIRPNLLLFYLLLIVASFLLLSVDMIDCCLPHLLVVFCCMIWWGGSAGQELKRREEGRLTEHQWRTIAVEIGRVFAVSSADGDEQYQQSQRSSVLSVDCRV